MDDQELTVLAISRANDPDGSKLRAALEAHFEVERLHALRVFLLYLMCVSGVPVWIAAGWPALLPAGLRNLSLLAWAACATGSVMCTISELRWRRRLLDGEADLARSRTVSS